MAKDYKVIHIAGEPTIEGDQYCLICGKKLAVSSKTYLPGEDVFEERATRSATLHLREYVRCTELV